MYGKTEEKRYVGGHIGKEINEEWGHWDEIEKETLAQLFISPENILSGFRSMKKGW